jgi:hypothetical protein
LENERYGKGDKVSIEERGRAAQMRLMESQHAGKEEELGIEERRAAQMRFHGSQMQLDNNPKAWGAEAKRFLSAISTFDHPN